MCGECLALRRRHLDIDNNIIHIKKTLTKDLDAKTILGNKTKTYAGDREIPMSEFVKRIFRQNTNFDFLFLQPNGKYITPSTINSHIKRIAKDAGIQEYIYTIKRKDKKTGKIKTIQSKSSKVHTHMLRHSYATRRIEGGMTAPVLQKLLGHSSVEITINKYFSAFNKFKQTEVDKANEYLIANNLI